jgi:hypothetical protein
MSFEADMPSTHVLDNTLVSEHFCGRRGASLHIRDNHLYSRMAHCGSTWLMVYRIELTLALMIVFQKLKGLSEVGE